jgi:hypothetical protein
MKNSILIIIISLLHVNLLCSQNEKLLSHIEKTEVDGQTVFLLNGEKYNGIIYENYPHTESIMRMDK